MPHFASRGMTLKQFQPGPTRRSLALLSINADHLHRQYIGTSFVSYNQRCLQAPPFSGTAKAPKATVSSCSGPSSDAAPNNPVLSPTPFVKTALRLFHATHGPCSSSHPTSQAGRGRHLGSPRWRPLRALRRPPRPFRPSWSSWRQSTRPGRCSTWSGRAWRPAGCSCPAPCPQKAAEFPRVMDCLASSLCAPLLLIASLGDRMQLSGSLPITPSLSKGPLQAPLVLSCFHWGP